MFTKNTLMGALGDTPEIWIPLRTETGTLTFSRNSDYPQETIQGFYNYPERDRIEISWAYHADNPNSTYSGYLDLSYLGDMPIPQNTEMRALISFMGVSGSTLFTLDGRPSMVSDGLFGSKYWAEQVAGMIAENSRWAKFLTPNNLAYIRGSQFHLGAFKIEIMYK